ncbi:MAG: hypothetical protein A3G49_03275 [Candidatus Sungbacteria bacterium RIFCSPLOWO2_12_FULL_41_11]|uniref:Uncharacterized protein n=1 Tax=Candidatus Sungbacteria bacterium RIFCSPLOWO2_12_FULL_41_11 TaxID=1802286 RepID=A0A1G2LVA7_9BACT|nr:MAG: hypothetical protein A3G49_03275 [Candidatus Sungbacteria bacterium RIFCSPLOWO2_12_FULL_41_11]
MPEARARRKGGVGGIPPRPSVPPERSEAASNSLRFFKMWSILEIVRTVFAAASGEEISPRNYEIAASPRR